MAHNDEIEKLLTEKFLNEDTKEYLLIGPEGTSLPKPYLKYAEAIENFEVRDTDVIVASYPKSGTTWTQEMVWMIGNNVDFEKAKTSLWERFPFLEICTLSYNHSFDVPSLTDSIGCINRQESPRYIKTHLPFSLLPQQIRDGTKKPKMIYVIRNPKDVCVSYYHHHRLLDEITANLEEFATLFLAGRENYGPYWKHILGYFNRRDLPNLLIIQYEDMKKDLKSVIRKVSDFLGKEISEEQTALLINHLSFESMKNNPSINYDEMIKNKRDGSFFRSGSVGQYKEELSAETINKLNQWIKSNVSNTGLEKEFNFQL